MNRFHLYISDIFMNKIRSYLVYTFVKMYFIFLFSSHLYLDTINQTLSLLRMPHHMQPTKQII
jgi:hypothetical protein